MAKVIFCADAGFFVQDVFIVQGWFTLNSFGKWKFWAKPS